MSRVENREKSVKVNMESFVIRILIASLVLATTCTTVAGRFIHRIEDYDRPTNVFVAECRKGCLIKVCTPKLPSQWQFNYRSFFSQFLQRPIDVFAIDNCSDQPNCFMCWDYCSMLYRERKRQLITKLMCTDDVCVSSRSSCSIH